VVQLLGRVLAETYRIESLLGRGGMGEVYLATHLRLPRRFAVKVLYAFGPAHSQEVTRFRREAEVVASLGHPHIVEVVDFNHTTEGAPYIVMELLEGEDLATRLKRVGRLSLGRTAKVLRQAASALHAAHQRGVIHRDLKPRNIFLCVKADQRDWVKVVDFGLSKVTGAHTQVTNAQMAIGTPRYMSPEQALGYSSKADARSDVFAMGAILYRSLSGQLPFRGNNVQTVLYQIVHLDPPPLTEAVPGLPPAVSAAVARALSKEPNDRYQSMEELSRAFHQAAGIAWPETPILSEESAAFALPDGGYDSSEDAPPGSRPSARSARTRSASTEAARQRRGAARAPDPMEGTELLAVDDPQTDDEEEVVTAGAGEDDELEDPLTAVAGESESGIPLTSADLSASYASAQGELSRPPVPPLEDPYLRPSRARRQRALAILAGTAVLAMGGVTLFVMLRVFRDPKLPPLSDASIRTQVPFPAPAIRPPRPDAALPTPDLAPVPDLQPRPAPDLRRPVAAPPAARYGQLYIFTRIDGAMGWAYVSIDGRRIEGQTPLTIPRLVAGIHTVRIEREGYRPLVEKVRIRPGKLTKASFELRR
jgi:serine/threonine protein kinase